MSLEQQIERLNSNLERIYGAGGFAAAEAAARGLGAVAGMNTTVTSAVESTDATPSVTTAAKPVAGRKPGAKGPQPTLEDVKAAAFAVKDKFGPESAKAIIANHGAASLVKLDPKKYAAFIAECNTELERETAEEAELPAEDEL
jgi:hypothetical protein